jgi:hypothetical protein
VEEVPIFLPVLLPPLFLMAAVVFTRRLRLRFRIIWSGLAVLISIPIGILAIFGPMLWLTYDPNREPNPGIGIAATPLLLGWFVAVLFWLLGSALALVWWARNRSRVSNLPNAPVP